MHSLVIVAPIVSVVSVFGPCIVMLYLVPLFSFAIISLRKRELCVNLKCAFVSCC